MTSTNPAVRHPVADVRGTTIAQRRLLRRAGAVFVVGFVVHDLDHARRGLAAVSDQVVWAGTLVAMLATVTFTLIVVGHRSAPVLAAAAGTAIAIGVSATHLLPAWGSLSDSLPDGRVDAFTWTAVLAEVVGALVLGLAGFAVVRQQLREVSAGSGGRSRSSGRR
jgi:hypothetical protein